MNRRDFLLGASAAAGGAAASGAAAAQEDNASGGNQSGSNTTGSGNMTGGNQSSGDGGGSTKTVEVGAGSGTSFAPEEVTIAPGDTSSGSGPARVAHTMSSPKTARSTAGVRKKAAE